MEKKMETAIWILIVAPIFPIIVTSMFFSRRVHVAIWYIPGAQKSSHKLTLGPKYILYKYMDPLGLL